MTTEKRELVTTGITDGPSLHSVLTSLSVSLPSQDGGGMGDSSSGFPVSFFITLPPKEGWRGSNTPAVLLLVITGAENVEYNYCDYILTGYLKKSSRRFLCSYFKLSADIKKGGIDTVGWLTFRAKYNVHTRKGEVTIEYSDKNPWYVNRNIIKRFD